MKKALVIGYLGISVAITEMTIYAAKKYPERFTSESAEKIRQEGVSIGQRLKTYAVMPVGLVLEAINDALEKHITKTSEN